jgi:uncharacterized membrane protein
MIRNLIPTGALLILSSLTAMAQTPAGVDFEKQILPIFKERCFDCHQKERTDEKGKVKKPKGKFRMDSAALMLKGGEEGSDLVPKDAAKSSIYTFTTLPADDDKIMPPKGDPLTKEQQELIKAWINEGANFGTWKGAED